MKWLGPTVANMVANTMVNTSFTMNMKHHQQQLQQQTNNTLNRNKRKQCLRTRINHGYPETINENAERSITESRKIHIYHLPQIALKE